MFFFNIQHLINLSNDLKESIDQTNLEDPLSRLEEKLKHKNINALLTYLLTPRSLLFCFRPGKIKGRQ